MSISKEHSGQTCSHQGHFPSGLPFRCFFVRLFPGYFSSSPVSKGLSRELEINESYLDKLADEVRKDLQ
jgi:hypothetical protein